MSTRSFTRRRFLATAGSVLSLSALRADDRSNPKLPDGSDAKDMITPEAQKAIDRGLAFLASSQHKQDGSWGHDRQQYAGNVAVSSLAGLAFMSGGHLPGRGNYGPVVEKAIEYVLGRESKQAGSPPGFLFQPANTQFGAMYSHGFGTLLLGEAYGAISNKALQKRVRETLERAVKLIIDTQNDEIGRAHV